MRRLLGFILAVVFLGLIVAPAAAQNDDWKNKWYWGAQAGAYFYSTRTLTNEMAFEAGGHWLITADRIGLQLGLSQVLYGDNATSAIVSGSETVNVSFTSGRRLQAEVYAFPTDGKLQVYAGGGFMINYISDAITDGTLTGTVAQNAIELIEDVSTKAFFTVSGGVQWRLGRLAVFGKYQFTPEGRDFLITSTQHALTGGIRYALAAANQDVTTNR